MLYVDNRDDWWPRAEPTTLSRIMSCGFLLIFCPLVLSKYNGWNLLGPYDGQAAAVFGFGYYVAVIRPWLGKSPNRRQQARYAARSIRSCLDGSGDAWGWDDFTSCSLTDPNVDRIRRLAGTVALPLGEDDTQTLIALAEKAEGIAADYGS